MKNFGLIFMILALGAGLGTGLAGIVQTLRDQNFDDRAWLSGARALAFEKAFDETLKIRDQARDAWGIAEYALFNEGRRDVVVGKDGWLFSAEEFAWPKNAAALIDKNRTYVIDTAQQLRAQGVYVKILLLPAKARLYQDELQHPYPTARAPLYNTLLEQFRRAGLDATDARALSDMPGTFFKTDTHWTSSGAALAAGMLFTSGAAPAFKPARAHTGDLMRYVPLGPLAARFGFTPEPAEEIEAPASSAATTSADDLFGDSQGPAIHLVGTSYSADARWGFANALEIASGQPVINFAMQGQGPFRAMQNYLTRTDISRPSTLVWEIPERYFPLPEGK